MQTNSHVAGMVFVRCPAPVGELELCVEIDGVLHVLPVPDKIAFRMAADIIAHADHKVTS